MENKEYMGVFDYKESDTFRPTVESRIHKDSPVSKTLTCREDSCCVLERERENRVVISEFANSLQKNVCGLWGLVTKIIKV